MPPLYLAFDVRVASFTKATFTRRISGTPQTLDSVIWHRFRPNATTTYAAWFHGDTPAPSVTAIGNTFITPPTAFPIGIKSVAREVLTICRSVPTWAKGLAIEINNSTGSAGQDAQVVFMLT